MAAKRPRKDDAIADLQNVLNVGGISNTGLQRVLRVIKQIPDLPEMSNKKLFSEAFHTRSTAYQINTTSHTPSIPSANERSTAIGSFR